MIKADNEAQERVVEGSVCLHDGGKCAADLCKCYELMKV